MLRDELLRSKNDEIARCLRSRKRKLSELYYATVGILGATDGAIAETLYEHKQQAFLDANDLSKGRYFNEATLPSFPDHAGLVARLEAHMRPAFDKVSSVQTSQKEIAQPSDVFQGPTEDRKQEQVQSLDSSLQNPPVPAGIEQFVPKPASSDSTSVQKHDVPVPSTDAKSHFVTSGTPISTHEHNASSNLTSPSHIRPNPQDRATLVSSKDASVPGPLRLSDASTQANSMRRPSLALATTTNSEQPLSPASSIEPFSNHTPAPPAASPDTSPDESADVEAHDVILKKQSSDVHDTPSHTATGTVGPIPHLTPDEQLRYEEAQSLKLNADLLAAKPPAGSPREPPSKQQPSEGADTAPKVSELGPSPSCQKQTQTQVQNGPSEEIGPEGKLSPTSSGFTESQVAQGLTSASIPMEVKLEKEATPVSKKISTSSINVMSQPVPERMTTRVSSGAIRHKSVSEILGETPKSQPHEKQTSITIHDHLRRKSPASHGSSTFVARVKEKKDSEKERTKLSTVVFPKKQLEKIDTLALTRQQSNDLITGLNEQQDYLFTLFQNKAYSPPRTSNITALLATAHKTVSTSNHLLEYQEQMDCRTLRRIYALQNSNRWPLRQMERAAEPLRQGSHWDVLLDHVKWMRTDFREERKWKIAAAKSCAEWCAEYVHSEPEHRIHLRIRTKTPAPQRPVEQSEVVDADNDRMMADQATDEFAPASQPTPDLVPADEESVSEGFVDESRADIRDTVAPAAIFSLGSDEFNFSFDFTPASEKLLGELPIYSPIGISPDDHMPLFRFQPDTDWKTDVVPVSKYATGRITFEEVGPDRKKPRYHYTLDNEDRGDAPTIDITPEQTNVALFRPENKHIRDRIHPGHSFRPPTEYPMPSVGFFESRQSSQWTLHEDDELRRLVKDYSYNWSLIASCLSSPSLFSSGAERRTPWECFERWVGLEGLPADMSKTQYFRAYHQRLEAAQRTILSQQQAAQQQQVLQQQQAQQGNNPAPAQPIVRRRTTQPVRVDRRRASRHLALLDAMRKLAKKRESMLLKQQQASQMASLRKVNEANQPKPPITNPADFSKLKYEREQKLQERQEQYRQQMIAQQRANLAAQRAGQLPGQQAAVMNGVVVRTSNGVQPTSVPPMPANTQNGAVNGVPPTANINHSIPMQAVPNGRPLTSPMPPNAMNVKMVPQQNIPQQLSTRPGIPIQGSPDNARVIREASRLQEQQRLLQSRQQQGQQGIPNGQQQFHTPQQFAPQGAHSPNMNVQGINGHPNNAAMLAAMQAASGMGSPSPYNNAQGMPAATPRVGQPGHLSAGMLPTITNIQNQIQRTHPNLSPEQVAKLATERLHVYQQQQQRITQAAMNAVGNVGAMPTNFQMPPDPNSNFQGTPQANGNPAVQNTQAQFSPMMRVAQPNQQGRVPVGSSPSMNGSVLPQQSRSATPQTQRSASAQTANVPGTNQSPHPPAAQMATN